MWVSLQCTYVYMDHVANAVYTRACPLTWYCPWLAYLHMVATCSCIMCVCSKDTLQLSVVVITHCNSAHEILFLPSIKVAQILYCIHCGHDHPLHLVLVVVVYNLSNLCTFVKYLTKQSHSECTVRQCKLLNVLPIIVLFCTCSSWSVSWSTEWHRHWGWESQHHFTLESQSWDWLHCHPPAHGWVSYRWVILILAKQKCRTYLIHD